MIERNRGHIVTIASAAGLIGVPRLTDYCATKFAAVGLDESLRVELKQRGSAIRTTVVCPYYIDTGMFEGVKTRFSFLLPILKEQKVVDKILRAIEGESRPASHPAHGPEHPFAPTTTDLLVRCHSPIYGNQRVDEQIRRPKTPIA